jgi:hypothetical protein
MLRTVGLTALVTLSLAACSSVAEPPFSLVNSEPPFEIRDYAPMLVAETTTTGDRDQAVNAGFRVLADFIFGNNRAQAEIAMTAPVTQAKGEDIAMTAPVTQTETGGAWTIGFVMPANYTSATLPLPNDPRVTIREIASRRIAVVVYSGLSGDDEVRAQTAALQTWMGQMNLTAAGSPVVARYDPPWTLPMFRRNEIQIEIREPAAS